MGIYYRAIDCYRKEYIDPPRGYSDKVPGLFSPGNPFPNMVIMANVYGMNFDIYNDNTATWEESCEKDYKDMTDYYFNKFKDMFKDHIFSE